MITVENLRKTFRIAKRSGGLGAAVKALFRRQHTLVQALDDISFTIPSGEILGYVGPNGAGKSTTIKLMTGVLVPDSGHCQIMGYTPWEQRVEYVRHIGVVFGQRSQLWWDVPVIDSYELLREIYHIPTQVYTANLTRLIDMLDLSDLLEVPVRQLSLGQRMRCELAASLLHSPRVLFLDEPTIGLDAVSKLAVREFIKMINRETGVTVLLTTHDMNDIEALANRIMLIGRGKILYTGTVDDLKNRFKTGKTITVDFSEQRHPIENIPHTTLVDLSPRRATLTVDTSQTTISAVIAHLSQAVQLSDISVESPSIEATMVRLYKEYGI